MTELKQFRTAISALNKTKFTEKGKTSGTTVHRGKEKQSQS